MSSDDDRDISDTTAGLHNEYAEEITDKSYEELKNLAFWGKMRGPEFFVIGGWAAWKYHSGLGSRDIDVVFRDRWMLELFLGVYYKENGYEQYGGPFNVRYRKSIRTEEREVLVEIDAASISEGPPFKEDRGKNIPFTLLNDYSSVWDLGSAMVHVPTPELLILQKTKAHRDRTWDLNHSVISSIDAARLRSKILKDQYDIRKIAAAVKNWEAVWTIAENCRCDDFVRDTFSSLRIEAH